MSKFISSDFADYAAKELNFSLQVCLKACISNDPRRVAEIGKRLDDLEMQTREAFNSLKELNKRRAKVKGLQSQEARDVQALRLLLSLEELNMAMRARYEQALRALKRRGRERYEHE